VALAPAAALFTGGVEAVDVEDEGRQDGGDDSADAGMVSR
jgi:hypothetical protein